MHNKGTKKKNACRLAKWALNVGRNNERKAKSQNPLYYYTKYMLYTSSYAVQLKYMHIKSEEFR